MNVTRLWKGEAISFYWQVGDSNRRNFWAYWANHINKIRYEAPALKPYLALFDIVKDKNYFIITTNVDGQFVKAGFNKEKIVSKSLSFNEDIKEVLTDINSTRFRI